MYHFLHNRVLQQFVHMPGTSLILFFLIAFQLAPCWLHMMKSQVDASYTISSEVQNCRLKKKTKFPNRTLKNRIGLTWQLESLALIALSGIHVRRLAQVTCAKMAIYTTPVNLMTN
jgi:hypothetical protein